MTSFEGSQDVARIDTKTAAKIASQVQDYDALVHDAAEASAEERGMTIIQSLRAYPKAVFFSVGISLAIVMEGYDGILLGNFYAQPAFTKKFGVCSITDGVEDCQIPASWQAGLSNGSQIGSLVGLQLVGWLTERMGYRKTMMLSLFFMTAFTFLPFFADNLVTLLMGQLLQGVPWGLYQTLAVSYAADVCPVSLRPILTTYVNLCWVLGQLIASGVLRATVTRTDKWAYKIPYALQWMWIPFIFAVSYFAPESPWWLVRQNRLEEAEVALRRLAGKSHNKAEDAKKTIALLKHTDEMEKTVTTGSSYLDCFRGTNRRRTEIACMAWLIQQTCGSPLMGFSSYFLQQAALPTTQAFNLTIGQFAIGAVGTVFSWFLMNWMGRRTLYLAGQMLMALALLSVGTMGVANASPWAIGGLLLVFTAVYDATVGPACYSIVAEIGSTRLRAKTVVLARGFYNLAGIIINIVQPRMINPEAWDLGAKSAYVWMATCFLGLIWTFFRLPEPKGRTYGELDVLFEERVSARKFKTTKVQEFAHLDASTIAAVRSEKTTLPGEADSFDEKKSSSDVVPVNSLSYNA